MNTITSITDLLDTLLGELNSWLTAGIQLLPNIVVAIFILILAVWLSKLASRLATRGLERISDNREITSLLRVLVRTAVMLIGIFLALNTVHLTGVVASLLAGVGVVGLALGFAFQDIAANFVSSVLLAVRRPYKLGDLIKTGDYFGTVSDIDLRNTYIQTLTGERVIIPNKDVYGDALINYTETPVRRVDIEVGVSYSDDLDAAKEAICAALDALETRHPQRPAEVFYTGFGGSSIDLVARFWTSPPTQRDFLAARSECIVTMKKALDSAGVSIPFPIRTLDFGAREVGGVRLQEELSVIEGGRRSE